jgi:hypothetical protein
VKKTKATFEQRLVTCLGELRINNILRLSPLLCEQEEAVSEKE